MKFSNVLISLLVLNSSCLYSHPSAEFYKDLPEKHSAEIEQNQLFNMIRKGVVTVKSNAHANKKYSSVWFGTGFIVDVEKGLIVTNAHVAGELAVCTYEVKFGNGTTAEAKLEYIDPSFDFAVLSVNKSEIPSYCSALKFSTKPVELNSTVFAMGNSAQNEFSAYKGYVFDKDSILWLKPIAEQSFQFSGLTVPGASGSPIFNLDGEVVGILYGGQFVSGAALPISYVVPVVRAIQAERPFKRYFLGAIFEYLSVQDAIDSDSLPKSAKEEYEKAFPNSSNKVLSVKKIVSAFCDKGCCLKAGDVVWKVDGELIGPELKKIDEIVQEKDGKSIKMTIYRDGSEKEVELTAKELSNKKKMKMLEFDGSVFFEAPDDLKIQKDQAGSGLCVTANDPGSAFYGLDSESKYSCFYYDSSVLNITEIDGKKMATLEDLKKMVPDILKKKVFKLKYKTLIGDSQERAAIVRHNPEFAEATLYTFNNDKKSWDVEQIKKPSAK